MEAPPVLSPQADLHGRTPVPRWRSVLMLILMGAYPLVVGLIGVQLRTGAPGESALPGTVSGLLRVCAENFGMFAVLFLGCAALGRPSRTELLATGGPGFRAWLLGLGYSVALRVGLAVLLMVGLTVAALVMVSQGRSPDALSAMRPQVETLLEPAALRNPVYLTLSVTVVSFVVAGLREELWRAVVFAGLLRLVPGWGGSVRGRLAVVGLASVIFGLGHLPQGWGGVVLTGLLGAGLGAILIFHRSLWIAVIAHGFFDATSFVLIRVVDGLGFLDQLMGK